MPSVRTSDIYLCQLATIVVFLIAEKLFFYVNHFLGYAVIVGSAAVVVAAFFSGVLSRRRLLPYSVALSIGALIFIAKWS